MTNLKQGSFKGQMQAKSAPGRQYLLATLLFLAGLLMYATSATRGPSKELTAISLPAGAPGIGFDDLRYAPSLGKLLVPAGRTGNLDLVDPVTKSVTVVGGFSSQADYSGSHDDSVTSADEGAGFIFAIDRTSRQLDVVDPTRRKINASTHLSGSPDYVRYVNLGRELWITEPDSERIEVFTLPASGIPTPRFKRAISVIGGPESLVIDPQRKRAYTHLWHGSTAAIDLSSGKVLAKWANGCQGSRGIALDEGSGLLFAGCSEGKATVMDLNQRGSILSTIDSGAGIDVISYNPSLRHLYLPGSESETMAIVQVSSAGKLSLLSTVRTARGAHCVSTDGKNGVWICDPQRGQLLFFEDKQSPGIGDKRPFP